MDVGEGNPPVSRERLPIVLKQGTSCDNVTALFIVNTSEKKLEFYRVILSFLRKRSGQHRRVLRKALLLAKGSGASCVLDGESLEKIYACVHGDLNHVDDCEDFVVAAFNDLSELANPHARGLFEDIRVQCEVRGPAFLLRVGKVKQPQRGTMGWAIIMTNSPGKLIKFIDEASGRGSPMTGKIMY